MNENKDTAPLNPNLIGNKVSLRPATPDDLLITHRWLTESNPDTIYNSVTRILSPAETADMFRHKRRSEMDTVLMVLENKEHRPVGTMTLLNYNSLNRSIELALLIDPEKREKGFGSDAVKIISKYLFMQRGLNKVYTQLSGFNLSGRKLFESIGFKKDASLRDHNFYQGEYHPTLIYSLLRYELDWLEFRPLF